ncbi:hypothetical protein DXG03_004435 [Asterophora parasitica]|uniref:DUF1692-domain-containing protein n=1 Tax=Asterophora parasitica TaxID=117018 RepID=A0A9P7G418_9AGAR|nr:hypothetical protein DXG03_004435 [Asterophora parasitica]
MSGPDILNKLDSAVPAPLAAFDAFPKIPSTYKARSESRGFMTVFVALLALLLMLNDIAEYVWGWPDQEFSIDNNKSSYMGINVDIVTTFDTSQATSFQQHRALSVQQVVAQSRKTRGLFSFFRRAKPDFRPTYNHAASADACRVWGTLGIKRVTANLHITTLGHGYASYDHVDHSRKSMLKPSKTSFDFLRVEMNLSHVISEFSFGPHFPDISQPLDYSYEVTHDPLIAYQYFLHVVPTTYIAPRSYPVHTNQYSVTHYTRVLEHNRGTPGIFFKFDLDPLAITIHQRTPSFLQLFIRCVGVLGGVFVCTSYFIKIGTRAVEVISGADAAPGLVAAEASGVKVGLRQKWGGAELRSRSSGKMIRQGSGWVMEGDGSSSPYASYAGTPTSNGFPTPGPPGSSSPYVNSFQVPPTPSSIPIPPTPNTAAGLGFPASPLPGASFGPAPGTPSAANLGHVRSPSGLNPAWTPRTPSLNGNGVHGNGVGSVPSTPGVYATYPASPAPGAGFQMGAPPPPRREAKKDD